MKKLTLSLGIGLFLSFLMASHQGLAEPLKPINVFQYLERLNELKHTPLDPKTMAVRTVEIADGCQFDRTKFLVNDPKTNEARQIEVSVYHPVVSGKYPAVIIVPTIIGKSVIEDLAAFRFCKKDFVAVIADVNSKEPPKTFPDWDLHDRYNYNANLNLETILDMVESHPQVNPQKIVGYGLSLGAFSMSLLSSVDSRLKAVVTIAGAGNMPAILTYSQQKYPVKLRELRMAATGDHDLLNYEKALRDHVRFDPIYMARNVDPKKYFMMINLDDIYVPAQNQVELWEAFGRPEHLDIHGPHRDAILSAVTIHFDEILKKIYSRIDI